MQIEHAGQLLSDLHPSYLFVSEVNYPKGPIL